MMNYNQYNTILFKNVFPSESVFLEKMSELPINNCITQDSMKLTYFLLMARYANNPIANLDKNQFIIKVGSIIFQFGPTWEKKLDIQKTLRGLSEEDIRYGTKAIFNKALNPSSEPSTDQLEEIAYINEQNTTNYKKSKLEGYGLLLELLKENVSGTYINQFKVLFKQFVAPEDLILYESESGDNE